MNTILPQASLSALPSVPLSIGPVLNDTPQQQVSSINDVLLSTLSPAQQLGLQTASGYGQTCFGGPNSYSGTMNGGLNQGAIPRDDVLATGQLAEFVRAIVDEVVQRVLSAVYGASSGLGASVDSRGPIGGVQCGLPSVNSLPNPQLSFVRDLIPVVKEAAPVIRDAVVDLGKGIGSAANNIFSGIGAGLGGLVGGISSLFS